MADEKSAIPASEQQVNTPVANEQEAQPGQAAGSETGTEQTSQQQNANPDSSEQGNPKDGKKRDPWWQNRINELTRERKTEAERAAKIAAENERLAKELESLRQSNQTPQPNTPASPQQDIDRMVAERVEAERKQAAFNDQCNRVYEAGKKEFQDFDAVLSNFNLLGEMPPTFIEAATALDGGHKVLHHLGNNLDLAAELLTLSPVQLAIRLSAINGDLKRPKTNPVSQAPQPIKPVDGTSKGDPDYSAASIDDFMERRNREKPIRK